MSDARADAVAWLRRFEAACRGRDFAEGRRLFAPDAVAFGTYATAVHGLDNIEREQWRQIWPRINDFRFEEAPTVTGSGDSAWIAATACRSPATAARPSTWPGATAGGWPSTATSPCCPASPRASTVGA
jgi:ketosteroid isomerase-like protein